MDRAEIVVCRSNGEDIFSESRSNSQIEKKRLALRGSLHFHIYLPHFTPFTPFRHRASKGLTIPRF